MTGTSLDALDACAVRAHGRGLAMRTEVVGGVTRPLGALAPRLRALAEGRPMTAGDIARLALEFGELHAGAVGELIDDVGRPALVALHGQTVFHAPPASWQMINPWPVAERAGCPVVSDLRGADLARGGQGAPITPMADWVMFRSPVETRAVVNLGGFCNMTLLPTGDSPERVSGRDVCACNHLLDGAARTALGLDFDPGGENAGKGTADETAKRELVRVLTAQSGAGRSLGTGDEGVAWVSSWNAKLSGPDLLASCIGALAEVIASATDGAARVILAGGGALNATLAHAVARCAGVPVGRSEEFGVPVGMREAAQMGVLGALSMDGVPITLPKVTGVSSPAPIAGAWIGAVPHRTEEGSAARRAGGAVERAPATRRSGALPDRSHVLTEQRNPRTERLDAMSVIEIVRAMNAEDAGVPAAVLSAAPAIAGFIEALEARVRSGQARGLAARLVYIGAGTSGRLGVLDASECPPTFQVDPGLVVGVIAGGDPSLRRSSEGREDERDGAREELERLAIGAHDTVLGIAAGGTTPYVLGAIEWAKKRGALTGMLSCSPLPEGGSGAEHDIVVPTGPEALTGSTRLKAGTATKLVLNMVSTALMVRLGKVHGNLMVDLRATNAKLRDRAARIVSTLTGLQRSDALSALDGAGGSAKVAAVMCLRGLPKAEAEARLARFGGRLRDALEGE